MSDKTLRQFSEDIDQRRLDLKQRSADAVSRYIEKSAGSTQTIANRRSDLMAKAKQSVADAISRKKEQEQQRAASKAAAQEKQDMKDSIKAELEAEREEKKEDNEEKRKSREKKRMEKEKKRERAQQVLDTTG